MDSLLKWERYPLVAQVATAKQWLLIQAKLGLAANTIDAYGRALEDYLSFTCRSCIPIEQVNTAQIAGYVNDLTERPSPKTKASQLAEKGPGLSNATLQQRLTVVRLFYDYLLEEGLRNNNPVGRGRYTSGKGFGGKRDRGLIPKFEKLPWIPNEEQWLSILQAAKKEPIRNRLMLAFTYDAALRREELCSLATSDIDPATQLIRIRAETTKNRKERMVPYSQSTQWLLSSYLMERRKISTGRGPLFLSESRRNRAAPISIWTWSKVIERIASDSGVLQFTTHTPRHLCLTDLARTGWDIHEIALFAGHKSVQTTLLYIHLSGRELKTKLEKGMAAIHAWRAKMLQEKLL